MANFDKNLSRMEYLMNYKPSINESVSPVECHMKGADGKVYGVIKEGNKYYIKTTEPGKETIAESYQYINGFNYRNENAYNSYNQATKMLEQKLMAINESRGIHEDVSTADLNRGEKLLEGLTKEARKELDRMKMIMENSENIGNHGDPESKGKSTAKETEKNNDPFSHKVKEALTRDDVKSESDPKKANSDYTDASKCVEKQMTSDKAPSCGDTNCENDAEKAKSDLEGVAVAEQNPKGGKAVMVKEGYGLLDGTDDLNDVSLEDFQDDVPYEDSEDEVVDDVDVEAEPGDGIVGVDDTEEEDFDALMEEFKERICGDEETLTGPHGTSEVLTVDEESASTQYPKSEEKQEALDGPKGCGKAIATETLKEGKNKKLNSIVESVVKEVLKESKYFDGYESPEEEGFYVCVDTDYSNGGKVTSFVGDIDDAKEAVNSSEGYVKGPFNTREEAFSYAQKNGLNPIEFDDMQLNETALHDWGKHPRYGEQAMTTPPDVDVKAGTADKDWNDDSAKGSECYGKKIGNGKPFDKQVDMLTDAVMVVIKEAMGLKKK